jgi:hypothetical protein
MKNFHLPLPERTYTELRTEAQHAQLPTTTLAREAIELWLRAKKKAARHREIATYAAAMAGTELDLDVALESAAVEFQLAARKERP